MRARDLLEIFRLPRATINLMAEKAAGNHPFYARLARDFHRLATSRHPKFLFARRYEYGFAMCALPETFQMYFARLEPAAHRNYRKALRLGYEVRRFDFNEHLDDVREILRSTPVRQGTLPPEIREGRVTPIANPPSNSSTHDYPYFGVFKDGKLHAYAACLVAGELCNLNDLFGHARRQNDGVVPLLLVEIARELLQSFPSVKYYAYDAYFGARENMRRFKRKFLFTPYRVSWRLSTEEAPAEAEKMLVYRWDISEAPEEAPSEGFIMAERPRDVLSFFPAWVRSFGGWEAVKNALKVLSGRRVFFGVVKDGGFAQSGWVNLGFCRYYPVESDAAVLGAVWTDPRFRGQGLASSAMRRAMARFHQRGYRRFYVDAGESNVPSQRMIAKSGFVERIA